MNQDENRRIIECQRFLESENLGTELSNLWSEYSKDFDLKKPSSLRGYGINNKFNQNKIDKFYKVSERVESIFSFLQKILRYMVYIIDIIKNYIKNIISLVIFNDRYAAERFSLKDYPSSIYNKHKKESDTYEEYNVFNEKEGFYFSHNSYKSFSYFQELKRFINFEENSIRNIIEVGSGVFNFGIILTKRLKEFTYVCIDLPDVAMQGYLSASEFIDNDVDIFLPHELNKFNSSKNKKKIIFLIPSQLENLERKFDLFVNHESFSEMNIDVVNNYLSTIKNKMESDSIIFLVNRFSRLQSKNEEDMSFTDFDNYELSDFKILLKKIETFRRYIPVQKFLPNIIFIGKKI
jgi:putative sugar O-methyltransferase